MPAAAMDAAGVCAVSWPALTYCVVKAVEPQLMTDDAEKFEPLTVSVNADPPAVAMAGERLVMAGVGAGMTIVMVALATALVLKLAAAAMALTVCVELTVNDDEFAVDAVVGGEPSVV